MIPTSSLGDVVLVSVHDEEPFAIHLASLTPSRYLIPGVSAPKEVFDGCNFSFPNEDPINYAVKRTLNDRTYVMVRVVESSKFIYGTDQQKFDEYGKKLVPDVQRIPVPERIERIANEIERQCGNDINGKRIGMGVRAVRQDQINDQLLKELDAEYVAFMRKTVADTNRLSRLGPVNITEQARRRASKLFERGLLNPLPEWAELNPDALGDQANTFNCRNCKRVIPKTTIKCECGYVYNWKEAVENGLISPSEVPPSKRFEAGLVAVGSSGFPTPRISGPSTSEAMQADLETIKNSAATAGLTEDEEEALAYLAASKQQDAEEVFEEPTAEETARTIQEE